jgi:hypothetical protein
MGTSHVEVTNVPPRGAPTEWHFCLIAKLKPISSIKASALKRFEAVCISLVMLSRIMTAGVVELSPTAQTM